MGGRQLSACERLLSCLGSGDRLAFEDQELGRSVTWAELDVASRSYAQQLRRLGVMLGDRVAVLAGSSIDLVIVLLANYRVGAVHVPINTRYRDDELRHVLHDSGARCIVVDAAGLESIEDLDAAVGLKRLGIDDAPAHLVDHALVHRDTAEAQRDLSAELWELPPDEALALMIYTSGTTGKSKGVCLTFKAVVEGIEALTNLWRWSASDRQYLALPLFHVHGLGIGVHGALLHANQTVLARRFDETQVIEAFETSPPSNVFMGVPTMYARLLRTLEADPQRAAPLRRARLFCSGSAALPARDFERFEALTGHRILERYGMSETLLSLSNPYEGERRPGCVGLPVPGYQVRVVDDDGAVVARGEIGELWVQGPGVMREYWELPEASAAAFEGPWFKTGDVVTQDDDGYLRIVGRRSVDIIKSGGFKISAREIEEALLLDVDIEGVAVLGLPDEEWGERIVAAIVPRAGAKARDDHQWQQRATELLKGRLADFKRPRVVRVVEEIPRNALGKVQKHRLRVRFD